MDELPLPTINKEDCEKYPRTSVTFDNVAPDMAYAFKEMCRAYKVDPGDYLTKFFKKAVEDGPGAGFLRVMQTGYEQELKNG